MCQNSIGDRTCQDGGNWNHCHDSVTNKKSVCLPDWKQRADGIRGGDHEHKTGNAPDGDEDAIVGIIMAVSAVADDVIKPSWYDEARMWADASSTAFFTFNVQPTKFGQSTDLRMLKNGACWGGWEHDGNNPSYHSPGSFKVMRDYQASFPNADRKGLYDAIPTNDWDKLITTSYQALNAVQCKDDGAMVPNWSTFTISNGGDVQVWGGDFSGSGTDQNEYGAEAARTTFRVAMDAALFPQDADDWSEFLDPFIVRLRHGHNTESSKSFNFDTFPNNCSPEINPGNDNYYMFKSGWLDNVFIYGPTVSALVAGKPEDGYLIDDAGLVLAQTLHPDYYHRSWAMLSNLMLSGAIENAGNLLK